ncbi:hypothetical protein [Geomesophilobacter sediminis]|uniref:Uncharacterized protein n=1 Tax=Geomesophilobacter sediminis TaxID=2798584 RepID=A0A8J7LYE5_9BACT|nr:hypothetical protein [Geomesophilobacter sediminis]MBJ6724921.1 hypothetical protein [Geomesophilobacter sediminis]
MMTQRRSFLFYCLGLSLIVGIGCAAPTLGAEAMLSTDASKPLQEMPVLTGVEWQGMSPDTKLAFVLGIGHVVTIEENVISKHPELKRKGFSAKLAEGLAGVPMDTVIGTVDTFYAAHPDEAGLPVMGVIWQQLVRPKLKTGIADKPLSKSDAP